MKKRNYIYRVEFKTPPLLGVDNRRDFYFKSLPDIYETFTAKQIGCAVGRLWCTKVSQGQPYLGRKCTITRELILQKTQGTKKND